LINKKEIMGEYTNGLVKNFVGWGTISLLVVLSMTMLGFSIFK
jgi:hypothetical protein